MHKKLTIQCGDCQKKYPYQFLLRCPECNGIINPIYDIKDFQLQDSESPLERYFSLIPLQDSSSILYIGEGNTRCIHAVDLGKAIGLKKLYIKDETKNITGSTKDRMATCVISQFSELGIKEFAASSTGNSSTAFAYAVQKHPNMRLHLFCGKDFVHRHAYYDHPRIQLHVIDGDFVEAGKQARKFAKDNNIIFEGGFFNMARREGLKTAYLEAYDQMPNNPDVVIQAVSSGMGLYGAYKGAQEYISLGRLNKMPKFVGAQQETCAPMVKAYEANSAVIREKDIITHPHGIAEAILRGDPTQVYPYMYSVINSSGGCFVSVNEQSIRDMQSMLKATEGIDACYASSTALAAAQELRNRNWLDPEEVILVNATGGMTRPVLDIKAEN